MFTQSTTVSPRDKILNIAGELFHRHGYAAVSVQQILVASQVSQKEFHSHFTDKADIGVIWLQRLERRMISLHRSFIEKPIPRSAQEYFNMMGEWLENSDFRSCQFANTAAGVDESGWI